MHNGLIVVFYTIFNQPICRFLCIEKNCLAIVYNHYRGFLNIIFKKNDRKILMFNLFLAYLFILFGNVPENETGI